MATVAEDRTLSVLDARPRFEGSNICTWIGFKHVMYVVEEAVLDHLRQSGLTPRRLFEEHGLGVEIVDSHARIMHALHMDDLSYFDRLHMWTEPANYGEWVTIWNDVKG